MNLLKPIWQFMFPHDDMPKIEIKKPQLKIQKPWFFYFFKCPYEEYVPVRKMPPIYFPLHEKESRQKKDTVIVPEGYEEKLTSAGVMFERTVNVDDGIEVDFINAKDAVLHKSELEAILNQYPSVNQKAVVLSKRCWAKGMTIPQTIIELKKNGCEYSRTYVAFFRKVFGEFQTKIGEGLRQIDL